MKFALFGDSVISLAVRWRVSGVCRNALPGHIPRGGSSLATFLILPSGEEDLESKSRFCERERTKAVVNGYGGQKTLTISDFVRIPAAATVYVTKDGSWHHPLLF